MAYFVSSGSVGDCLVCYDKKDLFMHENPGHLDERIHGVCRDCLKGVQDGGSYPVCPLCRRVIAQIDQECVLGLFDDREGLSTQLRKVFEESKEVRTRVLLAASGSQNLRVFLDHALARDLVEIFQEDLPLLALSISERTSLLRVAAVSGKQEIAQALLNHGPICPSDLRKIKTLAKRGIHLEEKEKSSVEKKVWQTLENKALRSLREVLKEEFSEEVLSLEKEQFLITFLLEVLLQREGGLALVVLSKLNTLSMDRDYQKVQTLLEGNASRLPYYTTLKQELEKFS